MLATKAWDKNEKCLFREEPKGKKRHSSKSLLVHTNGPMNWTATKETEESRKQQVHFHRTTLMTNVILGVFILQSKNYNWTSEWLQMQENWKCEAW